MCAHVSQAFIKIGFSQSQSTYVWQEIARINGKLSKFSFQNCFINKIQNIHYTVVLQQV